MWWGLIVVFGLIALAVLLNKPRLSTVADTSSAITWPNKSDMPVILGAVFGILLALLGITMIINSSSDDNPMQTKLFGERLLLCGAAIAIVGVSLLLNKRYSSQYKKQIMIPVMGIGLLVFWLVFRTTESSSLPGFTTELSGPMQVRVVNPNNFAVQVSLRSTVGDAGKDFSITTNGTYSVSVPSGQYDIYFKYSSDPKGLYKGDRFSILNNGVEIRIVKTVNGNYGIRKVN